jgi:MraZ protein
MFRGRYEHTVDSKGRLSIPSKFRDLLGERYDSRLVVTAFDGCLIAYPNAEWHILEERIAGLAEFKKETRALLRFFYSNAADCTIDKLGRILIPQPLRDYAKLDKDVVLIGAFKQFEIWSKPMWDAAEAAVSGEDVGKMLEDLGL